MNAKTEKKVKWSSRIAYAVGLITTDGNLSRDGRHINLTSKDNQLLETFKKCLNLRNKIGFKTSGFSKRKYPWVQFGDVVFYNWLSKVGLTPNKSKSIKRVKVPNKYFFDFLRGCFDGDGSCCGYRDKRWKNSFIFYVYFYSGSLKFIKWLRCKLKTLLNISGSVSHEYSVWRIKYAKKESKLIFSKMYYRNHLPHLERKFRKIKSLLNIDRKANH